MSTFLNRNPYRRAHRRSLFAGFDPILTAAVGALLVIGTLLVYAATRDWYSANGLDPEYYLKRHVINIVIGVFLAWGTTIIDYRLLRAYTPFIWGLGVLGLILVLIPLVSRFNLLRSLRSPSSSVFLCCFLNVRTIAMNQATKMFSKP
jgi:rod shape determining protein RodA